MMHRPTEIRAALETMEDAGEGQKDDLRIRKVMEAEGEDFCEFHAEITNVGSCPLTLKAERPACFP